MRRDPHNAIASVCHTPFPDPFPESCSQLPWQLCTRKGKHPDSSRNFGHRSELTLIPGECKCQLDGDLQRGRWWWEYTPSHHVLVLPCKVGTVTALALELKELNNVLMRKDHIIILSGE